MSARITNSMIGIETLLFSVVDGFGQDGFHDEQGAVDLGDPAGLPGGQGIAGGGAAGAPVHAIQTHPARLLGRNGGQHLGFPAKGAVTVGGGGLLVQPFGQRLECQQADRADRNEHHRLHPERVGEQAAEQGCRAACRKPDGYHAEGHALQRQETDGGKEPENGVNGHRTSLLLRLLYNKDVEMTICCYLRASAALSNLSVAGFAATAPLVGELSSSVSEDDGEV